MNNPSLLITIGNLQSIALLDCSKPEILAKDRLTSKNLPVLECAYFMRFSRMEVSASSSQFDPEIGMRTSNMDTNELLSWISPAQIQFWVEHLPEDPILVNTSVGWPAFGRWPNKMGFHLCEKSKLSNAILEEPYSAVWDLEVIGNVQWDNCMPVFTTYFSFWEPDTGGTPLLLGTEAWIREVLRDYCEKFRDSHFVVTEV